ncbi:MAG: hypothetical protein FWF46_05195 [Oscillospiraceae bacterium]|nr:hypothetical protein [Oscillospiraceae bacterium]
MKKGKLSIISIVLMTVILFSMFTTSVFATRYAVCLGTNFGTTAAPTITPSGERYDGDFTPNTANASITLSNISDISTIRSTAFTKAYLTATTPNGIPRIGSEVVFLNGHAGPNEIIFCYQNNFTYATGVRVGGDQVFDGFDCVGLNNVNMDHTQLITYAGCHSGYGDTNLLTASIARGATVAVGFNDEIHSRATDGQNWLLAYNTALGNGLYVKSAITWANSNAPTSDLATTVVYKGPAGTINIKTPILIAGAVTSMRNATLNDAIPVKSNEFNLNDIFLIEDVVIPYKVSKEITNENLDNYKKEFNFLIKEIIKMDNGFNTKDYKVSTHLYNNEDGSGFVRFDYYIDGIIQTNKVYMANIENNKIIDVSLVGIKKENLDNLKNVDNSKLSSKVKKFETDNKSKENSFSAINYNNQKNKEITSTYEYDFNTDTLRKVTNLSVTLNSGIIITDSEEVII